LQAAQAVNLVDIYFKVDGTVDEAHRAQALANMEPIMTLVEGFIEKSNVYLAGMSSDGAPVSMPVLTRTS
jgi:hypothetical protein